MDGCLQRSNKPDPCHYCLSSAISLRHSASETELMTAPRWTKRSLKSLESKRHLIPWSLVDPGMLFCPSTQFGLSTSYQSSRLVEHKESWKMMKIPTRSTVDGESYKGLSWCLSTLVYSTTFSIIIYIITQWVLCTYVCMYVRMDGWMDAWMHGCMDAWMHGWMDVWMYGCMDVWMYVCMSYACMYVCMYVCMHVCMHACMYVYIYIFISMSISKYSKVI